METVPCMQCYQGQEGCRKMVGDLTLTVLAPAAGLQSLGNGAPFHSDLRKPGGAILSSVQNALGPLADAGPMPG